MSEIKYKTYNFRAPVEWGDKLKEMGLSLSDVAREAFRQKIVDEVMTLKGLSQSSRDEFIMRLLNENRMLVEQNAELTKEVNTLQIERGALMKDEMSIQMIKEFRADYTDAQIAQKNKEGYTKT